MKHLTILRIATFVLALALVLSACGAPAPEEAPAQPEAPAATEAPAPTEAPPAAGGELQIPDIEEGKYNVALAMLSVHDDGGWSQAQYDGLQYLEANVEGVHTAYIESVAEGDRKSVV